MKKVLIFIMASSMAIAGGDVLTEPVEVEPVHESVSPFYVVVKAMVTNGGDKQEEHEYLESDSAFGAGIDLGYRFNHHFAMELSATCGRNDVTKEEGHEIEVAEATYKTYGVNLVYHHELSQEYAMFFKVGYEREYESIDDFGTDEDEDGFTAAIGFAYEINEHVAAIAEYEHSTIKGLHGDAFFVGMEYSF